MSGGSGPPFYLQNCEEMGLLINIFMKKPDIEEELYKKAPVNDLIIFSIYLITETGKECNFEILTEKCFKLFPKVFSIPGYPKWPDTRKLDRPLRALRSSKFITGNPKADFELTKKGRKRALEIAENFRQGKLL
jgi:hypothetical protein